MFDTITEVISHFIGYFHISAEEMRLRLNYERFRHEKAKSDEIEPYASTPADPTTYDLEGYDPGLRWKPKFKDDRFSSDPPEPPTPDNLSGGFDRNPFLQLPPVNLPPRPDAAMEWPERVRELELALPPPSSVGTATLQALALQDDDVFGDIEAAGFAPLESFAPQLDQMAELAKDLSALKLPQPDGPTPWVGVTKALKLQLGSAVEGKDVPDGAEVATFTGARASGVLVDGEAADEMPALADHMPEFLAKSGDDEAIGDVSEDDDPFGSQPLGHLVVAGANAIVNESHVSTSWLDARVIAVRGDVTQIAAISQVNVLSDQDNLGANQAPQVPSEILNAAYIGRTAAPALGTAPSPDALPANWLVARIEGDLINVNWIRQTTFATDHDRAVVTSLGSNTFVGLGGNELVNATLIGELGFQFDLIIVGGNMYDINVMNQRNVLLDDDVVSGGGRVSGGDNLLFNSASIEATGIDTFGRLTANFKGALDALADGATAMPSFLGTDGLFHGIEFLRVLYIAGDFVKMNLVEQVNVLGDNDQVKLAAEAAARVPGVEVEIVTGSNVLANIASVRDLGVDSTVMAGGEIYSDALIHQAGFVSTDAAPTGVSMPALANEAVAFLVDGMIDGPEGVASDGSLAPPPADGGSLDVMQTMLA